MSNICNPKVADGYKKDAFWGVALTRVLAFCSFCKRLWRWISPNCCWMVYTSSQQWLKFVFSFFIGKKTVKMPIFHLQEFGLSWTNMESISDCWLRSVAGEQFDPHSAVYRDLVASLDVRRPPGRVVSGRCELKACLIGNFMSGLY